MARLRKASGDMVSMSDNPLQLGIYDVYCDGMIRTSDEPWVQRIISYDVSGRDNVFREGIRARNGKCVITGVEKENLSIDITGMDDTTRESKINSCQNGFLLLASIHQHFNQYRLSVNYKIVVFGIDMLGSVLANMRGAGEPVFEHDFPPETDMMKEIREQRRGSSFG
ncbi:hypothetical protein DFP73DRAFT_580518 [Morchella snyderi]|nr:hypothetical protein DFP73DRAFT_580518 [Morchella snyderi]